MTKQGSNTNRPFVWEDEAIEKPRFRRVEAGSPPFRGVRRGGPGMPLEMADPEGDDLPRLGRPRNPWWRPASTTGRVFLGLGVLIVLGGFLTAGFLFKTYLERDARFRIAGAENIEATGLTQVSRADLLPVFGEDIGRNVFYVPLSERRKQLEEIPWVERATVMRVLPDQLHISVIERQPVAFTRVGRQIGLVDANGVLLNMSPATMAQHHYSFPVVTGIDPGDPLSSRTARMAVYRRMLAELDANNQHLSEQISEIDLTDPEDARVLMPEQGADILAHFGQDRFLERYQRYQAHIAEWRQQYPKLVAVDLRYDQQAVLEMARGANAVAAPVGSDSAGPDSASAAASDAKAANSPSPDPAGKTDLAGKTDVGDKAKPAAGVSAAPKPSTEVTAKPKAPIAKDKVAKDRAAKDKASRDKAAKEKTIRELTAKDKAAKKKRLEAQRTAANAKKKKPAATARPVAAEGQ